MASSSRHWVTVTAVAAALLVAACARPEPRVPVVPQTRAPAARTPARELTRPPAEIVRLLSSARFELRDVKRAEGGVMGVSKATAHFPVERVDLPVKWAPAPRATLDGWNAAPRKELAAFAIQQWFLGPDDWIVPPTAMRCVPLTEYPRMEEKPEPTIEGTRCVLGLLAAWLQHVTPAEVIYDPDRFTRDPAYAARVADFNLLTYLIEHRDGRSSNILVSEDGQRVYSVDNGIAFGNLVWNYFVTNWDVLRVPALRRASIDRLRRLTRADLDALLVVSELRADRKGVLRPTRPGPPFDPANGARVRSDQVQLGLTRQEIDGVAQRLTQLLARVDAGEIPAF